MHQVSQKPIYLSRLDEFNIIMTRLEAAIGDESTLTLEMLDLMTHSIDW